MKVCINSQTPLLRFNLSYNELLEKYGWLDDPLDISSLEEGVDYGTSPGGVTAMVQPLMQYMMQKGYISDAVWVSLGVNYPPRVRLDRLLLSHIEFEERQLKEYTMFKESLWASIHGLGASSIAGYRSYAHYNWVSAAELLEHVGKVDIFYVQDFQQLLTGQLIGPAAPAVLRWHVPFTPENFNPLFHKFVLKAMEGFDAVVVSTRRDLEGLIKSSYHGRAHQIYPFIDPAGWEQPPPSAVSAMSERIGLGKDEKLLLMVARMDRMKSHDTAIRALARLPGRVKLVLIGNGSFSSSRKGGLGHGKGSAWRAELELLAKDLHVEDRVVFLGYVTQEELRAAYSLASAVVLTSKVEGFGIAVLESWANRKPVVVSSGAGASELVVDGSNGYTFPAGDDEQLAQRLNQALGAKGDAMGTVGYETAKQCTLDLAAERERAVLEETAARYS
ncbi:MAG: glycosyltransferase family 4 protein [Nitrososphaerota archaeon]|nr:glycosyltransferase family 4 protein [Nitrososphaerota archaeon]MDG6939587.1 glycosyltransferase family 4 protein [Nitrososphaerota archaeon]